jgi:polyphosphate kinase
MALDYRHALLPFPPFLTLYRTARTGVPIDLIIRGMCTLRPGMPGISENIRVRSIVSRFLEHTQI